MSRAALMYHDVVNGNPDASGFPGGPAAHYKLDVDAFTAHLAALKAAKLPMGRVTSPPWASDAGAMLTFDDGGASALATGIALHERGITGHFFITTAHIDEAGFVTTDDIRALHAAGHVIGSHSHTHPAEITQLDATELALEWQTSVDRLRCILGEPVTVASIPGGFYSAAVAKAAEAAGIRFLFTSEPTIHTWRVGRCLVLGRYTVKRDSSADVAVALLSGAGVARAGQWWSWHIKKPLKRYARPIYGAIRKRLLIRSAASNEGYLHDG